MNLYVSCYIELKTVVIWLYSAKVNNQSKLELWCQCLDRSVS